MTTITVGGKTFTLVAMPSSPGFSDIDMTMGDSVSVVQSIYVPGQSQTQEWPGADLWTGQFVLPPMDRRTASPWKAFLAECRGMANVFQLGDQLAPQSLGSSSQNIPLVDGTVSTNNPYAAKVLFTKGWTPNKYRLLLPGDYLQVGFRLY